MNAEMVYCLEHEEMVKLEVVDLDHNPFCGHVASFTILNDGGEPAGVEFDFCEFPEGFAYCPPPELPKGWEDFAEPPRDDEILVMDLQSLALAGT